MAVQIMGFLNSSIQILCSMNKIKILFFLILLIPTISYSSYISGIYINKYMASSDKFYALVDKAIEHNMNAIVIDIKYDRGETAVEVDSIYSGIGAYSPIFELEKKLAYLKEHNIKAIARIVCFKDNYLGKFNNYKYAMRYPDNDVFRDLSYSIWVSPYSSFVRNYLINIAVKTAEIGFDEIQFDYIRFPSDFPDSSKPKWVNCPEYDGTGKFLIIESFLKQAYQKLKPLGVEISADVFGYTVWLDSIGIIGQNIEPMAQYTDIIYPMVYPSHFGKNFLNNGTKENRTYDIIYGSGINGNKKLSNLNTDIILFLQDFDWRASTMGDDYINNQIRATNDSHVKGYILWNPSSKYNYFDLDEKVIGNKDDSIIYPDKFYPTVRQ